MTRGVSIETDVPFHDCDPMFVVWHGRYFEYFARARTELFKQLELDIPEVANLGYRMYITESHCRHMFPLSYGDRAKVTATVTRLQPTVRVSYRVENLTKGRQSARGYTELATTDSKGDLVTAPPPAVLERLQKALAKPSSDNGHAKVEQ